MTIASPSTISAALSIIERQPEPTAIKFLSGETDAHPCFVLMWDDDQLFVHLRYIDKVTLGMKVRVWSSLDDICLFTPSTGEMAMIGSGGLHCIDISPLDGLTNALNAGLTVPHSI